MAGEGETYGERKKVERDDLRRVLRDMPNMELLLQFLLVGHTNCSQALDAGRWEYAERSFAAGLHPVFASSYACDAYSYKELCLSVGPWRNYRNDILTAMKVGNPGQPPGDKPGAGGLIGAGK